MVEPIRSSEKFGQASMGQGPAPKHTATGHESCAYYVQLGITYDPSDPLDFNRPIGEPVTPFIDMECPHRMGAGGAWYSEDYIKEIRETMHQLLELLPMQRSFTEEIYQNHEALYGYAWIGPVEADNLGYMRLLVDKMKDLTK